MTDLAGVPHVVHVVHRLAIGGLENGVVNLVNRISRDRYRQSIVCLAGFDTGFHARIDRPDVEVLSLDKRPGKDPGAYLRMWRLLRRLRPDVVHTRNLGTVDMQWIAAAASIPVRVHGEHGWEASDPGGLGARGLRIRRACRPAVHRYVTVSRDIARWLESEVCVQGDRIRQIYNGVDTDRFAPAPSARPTDSPARQPGPFPAGFLGPGVTVIGSVGRLDPVKNQLALLDAFHSIRLRPLAAGQRLKLVIAGDGPLRTTLERRTAELGLERDVWLAGPRNDTPEILRAIQVFALPSINEGISNTILEAMATAVPVVAARVGGNPEIVVDGETGSLYDPVDAGGLAAALARYVDDPALGRAHGLAGRERALREFSLEAMIQRYARLYDELILERRSGRSLQAPAEERR